MIEASEPRHGQLRPGGRTARVRAAVLAAALEELIATGYSGFSCEAVADRAGVHKTTVYRRWGSREGLILDVMLDQAHRRVPVPDTGTLVGDLAAYGMMILDNLRTPEVQGTVRAVAASGDRNHAVAEASSRFWHGRFALAGAMVQRAIDRGEVPAGTEAPLVMEALTGAIYFRLLASGGELDGPFVRRVAALVAAGACAGTCLDPAVAGADPADASDGAQKPGRSAEDAGVEPAGARTGTGEAGAGT